MKRKEEKDIKKRKHFVNQNEEGKVAKTSYNSSDVIEVKKEVQEGKGYIDLTKHLRKRRRKKKCCDCKSPYHIKKSCPKLRCFWCHKFGNLKVDTYRRKVNYIFNKIKEVYENKELKRIENKENKQIKKQQKELEIRVFKLRANQLNYKTIQTEKGGAFGAFWKEYPVRVYTSLGLPTPTLESLRTNKFKWELVNQLVERAAPLKNFTLMDGLTH